MRRIVQSVGGVFAGIAFVLLLISMTTSYWLEIRVVRGGLTSRELATFTRHRGLYQECWSDQGVEQGEVILYVDVRYVHVYVHVHVHVHVNVHIHVRVCKLDVMLICFL